MHAAAAIARGTYLAAKKLSLVDMEEMSIVCMAEESQLCEAMLSFCFLSAVVLAPLREKHVHCAFQELQQLQCASDSSL